MWPTAVLYHFIIAKTVGGCGHHMWTHSNWHNYGDDGVTAWGVNHLGDLYNLSLRSGAGVGHHRTQSAVVQVDGCKVLERRNSSALAMELRLSCTNPSRCWFVAWWHQAITWINVDIDLWCMLALGHNELTHCGLAAIDADPGQHWLRLSGNGLLSDRGTKPLPEPMLAPHQWGSVALSWVEFHTECPCYYSVFNEFEKYTFEITATSPMGRWDKSVCSVYRTKVVRQVASRHQYY